MVEQVGVDIPQVVLPLEGSLVVDFPMVGIPTQENMVGGFQLDIRQGMDKAEQDMAVRLDTQSGEGPEEVRVLEQVEVPDEQLERIRLERLPLVPHKMVEPRLDTLQELCIHMELE